MTEQLLVFAVLGATLVLFILDRWRYDLVALMALLTLALAGIIPGDEVFTGFGHPAVITVAAVLVVSRGLAEAGVIDLLGQMLSSLGKSPATLVLALTALVTVCSAFMNNVGALALLMPLAIKLGDSRDISPSVLLMPLAFGSLLGGMTTLIGTPPNIIIGAFRAEAAGEPFGLFDFAPVGVGIAVVGLGFLAVGWRLIPRRVEPGAGEALFDFDAYTTEVVVGEDSPFAGQALMALTRETGIELVVAAIARGRRRIFAPDAAFQVEAGDRLVVEVAPAHLDALVKEADLRLAGASAFGEGDEIDPGQLHLVEAVVMPRGRLARRTPLEVQMRRTYGLNLLAVARQGARIQRQLKNIRFEPGDVLLLQAQGDHLTAPFAELGLLRVSTREVAIASRRRLLMALGFFGLAIVALALRLLPAQVAFAAAALAMVLTRIVRLRDAYQAIDWPILVLLGAMIPVGGALEASGGAATMAHALSAVGGHLPLPITLAIVLIAAMVLSDVMNNAATAVIMAPIAVGIATDLGFSSDPFLMAVAVGASCAFLTPIGHQSNTLVMGPGGYRFSDYWRLGLPLEILIVLLGVPLILWAWPP
ncbi:MAG: SLC13 family permease [Acidobacteriota bacterium]